jgi:RimJ/RimL family protein N-acetyltransferase
VDRIETARLDLVAATVLLLDAELESRARLTELLQADVPEGWPPGEYDRAAIEFFRARLAERPDAAGWYCWYAVRRGDAGEPAVVVGTGGYFGPPDATGQVGVGYSIQPEFAGRGYATEMVRALVARAFATPGVRRVIARARPENRPSITVLERCGFVLSGPGPEPETVEYSASRPKEAQPR